MKLHELSPAEGSKKEAKRVGRGHGSGQGKTAGKGHKGQKARAGKGVRPGFEGGQMPSYRQMPKLKGFTNFAALNCAEINVKDIEKLDAAEIDLTWLIENGKAHPKSEVLRVLGNGEISKSVTVKARYFTPSAKEKIEKAGGKAELV